MLHLNIQDLEEKSNMIEDFLIDNIVNLLCLTELHLDVKICNQIALDDWITTSIYNIFSKSNDFPV